MKILNQGFDHVEYILRDLEGQKRVFQRMGFEQIGERYLPGRGLKSLALAQGLVRIILTAPDGSPEGEKEWSTRFLRTQDEGICLLAIEVDDATAAFNEAVSKGARPAMQPTTYESPQGRVTRAEIWTPAQVRYAFMERQTTRPGGAALFDEGMPVSRLESPMPMKIRQIDHLTNNVSIGDMQKWVEFYQKIFGFKIIRHFDIRTGRTGLTSDAVQSQCGRITVPINEATEPESQVQEFVDRMKGAGVQHLAFLTDNLMGTLRSLREKEFKFLNVPHSYYEVVPKRVPGVTESLVELEELGILLDSEGPGYLMQIFSEEVLGPFFFEFIQRKGGNQGFGDGNFRALFEAIERDQIKRGVLKA